MPSRGLDTRLSHTHTSTHCTINNYVFIYICVFMYVEVHTEAGGKGVRVCVCFCVSLSVCVFLYLCVCPVSALFLCVFVCVYRESSMGGAQSSVDSISNETLAEYAKANAQRYTLEDLSQLRAQFLQVQPASRKEPGLQFHEFLIFCKLLGLEDDRETLGVLFAGLEKDKHGRVGFHELVELACCYAKGSEEEKHAFLFDCIDLKGDGMITPTEAKRVFQQAHATSGNSRSFDRIRMQMITDEFMKQDLDGDGAVSFEEFSMQYMGHTRTSAPSSPTASSSSHSSHTHPNTSQPQVSPLRRRVRRSQSPVLHRGRRSASPVQGRGTATTTAAPHRK